MHNAALRAPGLQAWRYQHLPVPPELFGETVRALPGSGFRGVNVTIPHKEAALGLATESSERARAIGAANTLLFEPDGTLGADNTDAPALIDALPFAVRGRTALVLGAGGSARAAVWALQEAGARRVAVWNRTRPRAEELAATLGADVVDGAESADVLVNCTAVGLRGGEDPFKELPLAADDLDAFGCVVDYVYTRTETRLVQAARRRSASVVDGLTLLVGQGALAFTLFTGRPAPVETMRQAVIER
jgi:shikimate dehydrogenase